MSPEPRTDLYDHHLGSGPESGLVRLEKPRRRGSAVYEDGNLSTA